VHYTQVYKDAYTMYIGEPHSVAAMTPSCKNRAKPKSAANTKTNDMRCITGDSNLQKTLQSASLASRVSRWSLAAY